jgi:hypothetical protein
MLDQSVSQRAITLYLQNNVFDSVCQFPVSTLIPTDAQQSNSNKNL